MDQSGRNKRRVTVDDGDSDDERALSRGSGNGGGSQSRRVTVDDGESDDEHAAQLRARSRGSNGGGSQSDKKKNTPKKKIASHVGPFGMRIPDDSELVFPPGVEEAPPTTKAEGQKKRRPAYASSSLSADSLHPGALPPAQRMLFAAAGASAPSPIALPAAEFARLTPAEQAEQRALEREYAQRLSQKAERESAQAFTDERVRQVEQARAGVTASWSDPSRKGMTILTPEQVAWRRAAGTYVERGAKTLGNGKVAVREPQALAGLRASEARERLEERFLRHPTNEAQAVKKERARAQLAYLDYLHACKEDPGRQHPQAFIEHYKDLFAKQVRWRDARNDHWRFARYDGLHDFKKQHGLLERAKRGSVAAAARANAGVGHADLDRQQASFRGDGGMPSETVDEDEEAKKVKTAADTHFNVYLLPHPQKGEALKAVPDRATVERALASEPFESLTWREILKRYAPTEEVGLGRRFQYDELPRALRHGGVVLMRQRATELSKPNRAFVFPYLKAWMFEGAANMERAAFIEAEVERFRRERALSASRGDLFHGEEGTGGFTDEAAVIAHAQRDFDRYLQRLEADDSEEAVAARAKAEKEERARRAHAASIREAFLTQEPRDNDNDSSDSDDSSDSSSSDAEPYRPPAGDGGGFH